jgi:hypothetical protein
MVRSKYRGGNIVKKVILVAALVAMVLVTAVPALASVSNTGSKIQQTKISTVGSQTTGVGQTSGQAVDSGKPRQKITIK